MSFANANPKVSIVFISLYSGELILINGIGELLDGIMEMVISSQDAFGDSPLFGDREFGLMKKGVYLINAARGGLVDEEAFVKALDRGQIAGAWLDTFDQEPYSGPLCQYEQVMLTPHIGSYTVECRRQMELEAVNNLIKGFEELEGV